jgi:hypothetical protein
MPTRQCCNLIWLLHAAALVALGCLLFSQSHAALAPCVTDGACGCACVPQAADCQAPD